MRQAQGHKYPQTPHRQARKLKRKTDRHNKGLIGIDFPVGSIFLPSIIFADIIDMPFGKYYIGVLELDKELKESLSVLNENLKAVVDNQYLMYLRLCDIINKLNDLTKSQQKQ